MIGAYQKPFKTLFGIIVLLVLVETALQARSHIARGRSVINALTEETTYFHSERHGLKLLRPSATISGSDASIVTNSMGLRSPEISRTKPEGTLRIAFVGASTVMGAYTPKNEQTFAYQAADMIEERFPGRSVEVINAGIAGYGLASQTRIIDRMLAPLEVDIVVLYTGFNDISAYCNRKRTESPHQPINHPLHSLELPGWVLSLDLLKKNSLFLRQTEAREGDERELEDLDLSAYRDRLGTLMATAESHGMRLLALTNARAFRRDMPAEMQERLSRSTRYYTDCFDLPELHDVYDAHNRIIREVATKRGVPVLPLATMMPGGSRYFSDGAHFSTTGERFAARAVTEALAEEGML